MTLQEREVMQMALDALELLNGAQTVDGIFIYTDEETKALRAALAQPEPEPVAKFSDVIQVVQAYANARYYEWKLEPENEFYRSSYMEGMVDSSSDLLAIIMKLPRTAPPQREWQCLSDHDLCRVINYWTADDGKVVSLCRAIEAKLRELNT